MIAHYSVGTQINCKHGRKQFDAIHDPLPAVFEIKTREGIFATQEGTPHAAGDAVVVGCVV